MSHRRNGFEIILNDKETVYIFASIVNHLPAIFICTLKALAAFKEILLNSWFYKMLNFYTGMSYIIYCQNHYWQPDIHNNYD